jgi:hypothetical protein
MSCRLCSTWCPGGGSSSSHSSWTYLEPGNWLGLFVFPILFSIHWSLSRCGLYIEQCADSSWDQQQSISIMHSKCCTWSQSHVESGKQIIVKAPHKNSATSQLWHRGDRAFNIWAFREYSRSKLLHLLYYSPCATIILILFLCLFSRQYCKYL